MRDSRHPPQDWKVIRKLIPISLILGMILVVVVLHEWRLANRENAVRDTGMHTTATIVDIDDVDGVGCIYTLQYLDQRQQHHEQVIPCHGGYMTGDTAAIVYDPNDPTYVVIAEPSDSLISLLLQTAAGSLFDVVPMGQ